MTSLPDCRKDAPQGDPPFDIMGPHSGRFVCCFPCFFSATRGWANVVAIASAVLRGVARSESIALCILQQTHKQAGGVGFETIPAPLVIALKRMPCQ